MPSEKPKDNSGALFDNIMRKKELTRDSHLALFLDTPRSVISEIRGGRDRAYRPGQANRRSAV